MPHQWDKGSFPFYLPTPERREQHILQVLWSGDAEALIESLFHNAEVAC